MDGTGPCMVLDADRYWCARYPCRDRRHLRSFEETGRSRVAAAHYHLNARGGTALWTNIIHTGLSSIRGLFQPRRGNTHPRAAFHHTPPAARVESLPLHRARIRFPDQKEWTYRPRRFLSVYVDSTCDRSSGGDGNGDDRALCINSCHACTAVVGGISRHRVVGKPAVAAAKL